MMSECPNCNKSSDTTYKFCPYCGKAKTNSDVGSYEEGYLRVIHVSKDRQVIDNGKSIILGITKLDEKVTVYFFKLLLVAFHPQLGEYTALESELFRDIMNIHVRGLRHLESEWYYRKKTSSHWYNEVKVERQLTWENFNQTLISGNWKGITDVAKKRNNPIKSLGGICSWTFDANYEPMPFNLEHYRYERNLI